MKSDLMLGELRRTALFQAKARGLEVDDAEDVAQEAVIRAWQALPRYRGEGSLSSWSWTIVRNLCAEASRRRQARHRAEVVNLALYPRIPVRPEDVALKRMLLAEVLVALGELPALQREALSAVAAGYSGHELAAVYQVAPVTVRANASKGRSSLRKRFTSDWPTST
jgi:RNA polymerase sigma-70 factor (ECF subfamily)